MIIVFHSLFIMGRIVYHVICDKLFTEKCYLNDIYVHLEPRDFTIKSYAFSKRFISELKAAPLPKAGSIMARYEEEAGLKFYPPAYVQRYNVVKEVLSREMWRGKLKKVLDVGCAELSLFTFLKNTPGIEEVLALDIDSPLLESVAHRVGPLLVDHLSSRTTPLNVKVLAGNIAKPDPCLKGCDAVIAIELIEHLYPGDLEEIPFSIFGFIRPAVALITTPNADFNVLFGHLHAFRHADHKFEWKRVQFQDWALNVVRRYPDYEVAFQGIGVGPVGSECLGCCTQMAIFTKINVQHLANEHDVTQMSKNASVLDPADPLSNQGNYKIIAEYEYPVYVDTRSDKQKIQDSTTCYIFNAASKITYARQRSYEEYEDKEGCSMEDDDDDDDILIPLEEISSVLKEWNFTEDQLRDVLEEHGWDVETHTGRLVVNYTKYDNKNQRSSEDEEDGTQERRFTPQNRAESDSEWEGNDKNEKDWGPVTQNLSPEPSCESDWNEEDTQARANMDSGYPNSLSIQDRDFVNSVDLHGSSLEEDSEDNMEEEVANGLVDPDEVQGEQNENVDNANQLNVAPVHDLFYEVEGNQDENQDVVNNNCDNEGNNAEAVFGLNDGGEEGLLEVDGSGSEADNVENLSEEESDIEAQQIRLEEELELMEQLLQRVPLPRRRSLPWRELNDYPANQPVDFQQPGNMVNVGQDAAGDAWQNLPALPAVDGDHDEGFAEGLAGPAIAVAPVDEGGAGEPSPF